MVESERLRSLIKGFCFAFISILMPYYACKFKQRDDFCDKLKHDVLQQDLKEHRLLIFD